TLLQPLNHHAVDASPDALGCKQANAVYSSSRNHRSRLLVPVADQVGLPRYTIAIRFEELVNVCIAERRTQELPTKERRIANDDLRVGPNRLPPLLVEKRVAALDRVEGLEDWVGPIPEAVVHHPLNLTAPYGNSGQFGCVGVDLDAEQG